MFCKLKFFSNVTFSATKYTVLQDTTARTEHPGKNSIGRTDRTGQSGRRDCQERTIRKDGQDKTAWQEQPGHDPKNDRTVRA